MEGKIKMNFIYIECEDNIQIANDGIILWAFANMITSLQIPLRQEVAWLDGNSQLFRKDSATPKFVTRSLTVYLLPI